MSNIVWTDLTTAWPTDTQLAAVAVPFQNLILDYVNKELNVALFGGEDASKTKLARMFLAAHFGKMVPVAVATGAGGSVAGPMVSSSAGGLTRSFGSLMAAGGAGTFSQTAYGQEFQSLLATTVARFGFVT